MENGPGWRPDPVDGDQERYWNGSDWTDRVRPAGRSRSLRLPEHVPELQRALAASTADIDAVEDRLSTLFDRTDGPAPASGFSPARPLPPTNWRGDDREGDDVFTQLDHDVVDSGDEVDAEPVHAEFAELGDEGDDAFAELDAALVTEEPDQPEGSKRGLFRRRS
jgi:hypothetical protein